jgi:Uncharacterized enzyme of heme biosynthesis
MPWCTRAICVFTLLATPAAAQSTTEDGMRAMVRGDYPTALRILRPIADDPAHPDPVAQFLLGILTDTGHTGNNTRACGLFLRAASRPNPFAEQSAALAAAARDLLGDGASFFCIAEEGWQGGGPLTFTLGPEHQVIFTDRSIRVIYKDKEQLTNLIPSPDVVYLPIAYTPLMVTRPVPATRHFLQWFMWQKDPAARPVSWKLYWTLFEVVDDQMILNASEVLLVMNGGTPPASDVSNLARIRVNANGEAEFTIMGGSAPRTELITRKEMR